MLCGIHGQSIGCCYCCMMMGSLETMNPWEVKHAGCNQTNSNRTTGPLQRHHHTASHSDWSHGHSNALQISSLSGGNLVRLKPSFSPFKSKDGKSSRSAVGMLNPIWASGVPQGSILVLFCFLLLKGKLLLKIVDRQAHNATLCVAL